MGVDECEECGTKIGLEWNAFKMCNRCTKKTNETIKRIAKKIIINNTNQKDFKLPDLRGKFFKENDV